MAADETVQVTLRVPRHQREEWQEHAADLEMDQSEFLLSMVQAGRRGFEDEEPTSSARGRSEGGFEATTPGVNGLESRVLEVIREQGEARWEDLVEELVVDFEDAVVETLKRLENEGRIESDPRTGYSLSDGE